MMNQPRRDFLKTGLLSTAVVLGSRYVHAAGKPRTTLGLQLYTVRDDMKRDPLGTLRSLAAMGYRYVEHADYHDRKFYGFPAAEFRKHLDGMGLRMCSGHVQLSMSAWDASRNTFTDAWKQTLEDAATLGQQYLVNPWMDESLRTDYEGLSKLMDLFNRSGALCKQYGLRFGYHNHDFEFNTTLKGRRLFDIIMEKTDRSVVAMQLDIGNMYGAGGRALEVLKQYPGRFELMHVKDEIKSTGGEMNEGYESTVLGKGILPVREIVDYGRDKAGITFFIIEQESYQGKTPLDSSREDLAVMKGWGY